MNYSFIESLKSDYRVTELSHAFRVNGVVDIWKFKNKLYDIVENKYIDPPNRKEGEKMAVELLLKYPVRDDFKQQKHGISYQEFKTNAFKAQYDPQASHAEDYHWGQNNLNTSEDHLYFAIIEDKVKIGRSKNPHGRIKSMQTALFKNPKVYVFNNKGFMETKLHHLFSDFKLNREWFKFDMRIQHFLKKHHSESVGYIIWPDNKTNSNGRTNKRKAARWNN